MTAPQAAPGATLLRRLCAFLVRAEGGAHSYRLVHHAASGQDVVGEWPAPSGDMLSVLADEIISTAIDYAENAEQRCDMTLRSLASDGGDRLAFKFRAIPEERPSPLSGESMGEGLIKYLGKSLEAKDRMLFAAQASTITTYESLLKRKDDVIDGLMLEIRTLHTALRATVEGADAARDEVEDGQVATVLVGMVDNILEKALAAKNVSPGSGNGSGAGGSSSSEQAAGGSTVQ